jgi:amino acid transporter/mannitol/fructose-specific phosphotransferase system IIA component (Ntr-type)
MELKKDLGFIDVFAVATGAMISSGIFILPGIAFPKVGPAIFLSYFFAGLLALTGALSIAELASAMPKAGGDYFFITRSLGPLTGTISGLLSWFSLSLKTAFAIIGIAEILHIFFGFNLILSSITICLVFVVINLIGVKEAGKVEVFVVMGLLILMVLCVGFGLPNVQVMNFHPFAPEGFNAILLTAGFVFVSYGGLLNVASIAEEVDNPKRNIPLGLFSSLFVVMIFYSLLLIITVGTLEPETLSGSLTPIADSARTFMGNPGYVLLILAGLLAFISTANAGIMSASRYPFALSRDDLLPDFISKVSKRFKTPIVSILLTGVFIILSFFLQLEVLVKVASTVVILTYILSNLSIIILRESKLHNYQPSFKSPFYPYVQIVGIIAFSLLIFDMGLQIILISCGLILAGFIFYFSYGRIKNKSEYAFLHLIARITNKKMRTFNLEEELRQILHERDQIAYDRFDHLIQDAEVLDLKGSYEVDEVFRKIAELLSEKVEVSEEKILEMLKTREAESSTAISSFVAIPHLVLDGMDTFEIILIRCKDGVRFSERFDSIRAIFVLAGTKAERNFHLRALAAVAHICQNKDFEKKWLSAKNREGLRHLILLSERKRME